MKISKNVRIFLGLLTVNLCVTVLYNVVVPGKSAFRDARNVHGTFIPYGEPAHPDIMIGCPDDWPLEFTVRTKQVEGGIELEQVCKNKEDNEWTCAKGWDKHQTEPKCIRANVSFRYKPPDNTHYFKPAFVRKLKNSYISDEHKLLFINVPSNNARVIETSFLFNDMPESGHRLGGHYKTDDFDEQFFKEYYKFAVIRHPCSRLLSGWNSKDNSTASSFEALLRTVHHLQTQVGLMFDDNGHFGLDQLIVFERWNQSVDLLGKRLNIELSSLKRSQSQINCRNIYTTEIWDKLVSIYWMDFCVFGYSTDMDRIDLAPLLSPLVSDLNRRFQNCLSEERRPNIDKTSGPGLQSKTKSLEAIVDTQSDPCVINTYFQPSGNTEPAAQMANQKTIDAWKESWTLAGWKPRVLREDDAKSHPQYLEFRRKFEDLPTVNPKEYEVACFMRHVAMAAVGGGWMTDYDVLPFYIPTCLKPLNNGNFTVYQGHVPCLVSGSADEFTRVASRMANWKENSKYMYSENGQPHVSDMHVISALYKEGAIHSMHVVVEADKLFASPSICDYLSQDRSIPDGLPKRSFAIHYSHTAIASIGKLITKSSSLWPGSPWGSERSNWTSVNMRGEFMVDSIKYIYGKCNCTANSLE